MKGNLLKIYEVGEPILRQVSRPVNCIQDRLIQQLIGDLIATAQDANGVGIAAPQVAHALRLLIVASRPTLRYPQAPLMEPTAMINPRICSHSSQKIKDWEGCLSVPGVRGLVPRYQWVEVVYFNQNGQECLAHFEDFVARIFQHEYDHLEGILYIDRLESDADLISEDDYQKMIINE